MEPFWLWKNIPWLSVQFSPLIPQEKPWKQLWTEVTLIQTVDIRHEDIDCRHRRHKDIDCSYPVWKNGVLSSVFCRIWLQPYPAWRHRPVWGGCCQPSGLCVWYCCRGGRQGPAKSAYTPPWSEAPSGVSPVLQGHTNAWNQKQRNIW